ncbi:hypothetical protein HK151_12600 [Streptococcus agalactiae]|nr:hypothetical protein [Streptococcus agalactiae]
MTDNRFAQLKETFDKEPPKKRAQSPRKKVAAQKSPDSYDKKGRFPFSLHHDVRYEKLEALVAYHGAKSASDYLETMIVKEWNKMQRKLKSQDK